DVFAGEARIMTEVSFLAEGKTKPVIYFTQGAGEIDISESLGRSRPMRTATELREYLKSRNFDVRTVTPPEPGGPKISFDDATAVVVLGPQRKLDPAIVDALTEYMKPDKIGQKIGGKLMLCLQPAPVRDGTDIADIGLKPLMDKFNVRVEDEVLLSAPV